jgi:hypothetical protein
MEFKAESITDSRATNYDLESSLAEVIGNQYINATMNSLYSEQSHSIKELPPPDGPVSLNIQYSSKDIGKVYRKRSVLFLEYPFGLKSGRIMVTDIKVNDVNDLEKTAMIKESVRSVASSVEDAEKGWIGKGWLGDINLNKTYINSRDNKKRKYRQEFSCEFVPNLDIRADWEAMSTFPSVPLELQKQYTQNLDTYVDNIPQTWLRDKGPSKMDLTISRRVLFDEHEAYEVNVKQKGYFGAELGSQSMKASLDIEGRYYVSSETGEILWMECKCVLDDCTSPRWTGVSLELREEMIPSSF